MNNPESRLPQTDKEIADNTAQGVLNYLERKLPEEIKEELLKKICESNPEGVITLLTSQVGDPDNNLAVIQDIKTHPCTTSPEVMAKQYKDIDAAIALENPLSIFRHF